MVVDKPNGLKIVIAYSFFIDDFNEIFFFDNFEKLVDIFAVSFQVTSFAPFNFDHCIFIVSGNKFAPIFEYDEFFSNLFIFIAIDEKFNFSNTELDDLFFKIYLFFFGKDCFFTLFCNKACNFFLELFVFFDGLDVYLVTFVEKDVDDISFPQFLKLFQEYPQVALESFIILSIILFKNAFISVDEIDV